MTPDGHAEHYVYLYRDKRDRVSLRRIRAELAGRL